MMAGEHYRLRRDPKSSHQQIARLLRELRPGQVLDVGAAQGILGQLLSAESKIEDRGSKIEIDAIEPNPAWAEAAKPFYRRVMNSTVEAAELGENVYDCVVCADVLEHLPDPLSTLKRLRQAAKGDATFIISLPNVAHVAVRTMLLLGRFPKMERGILDKTHLQFFTKDTAKDLLANAGLRIERVLTTVVPLEDFGNGFLTKSMMGMQRLAVAVLPRLFAMQWIFIAKPITQ
jgi:2-polyprenyl-3-methyl-5-hydroxy-6-metoxy-1,4-benzoquinol methylase